MSVRPANNMWCFPFEQPVVRRGGFPYRSKEMRVPNVIPLCSFSPSISLDSLNPKGIPILHIFPPTI